MEEPLVARSLLGSVCPMREANPRKPNLPVIWYMQQTFCPAQIRKKSKQCSDKRLVVAGAPLGCWRDGTENIIHEWQPTATSTTITHATLLTLLASPLYPWLVKLQIEQNLSFLWFIFCPVCPWLNTLHHWPANIDLMIQCFTIKIKHLTTLYNICPNELSNIK